MLAAFSGLELPTPRRGRDERRESWDRYNKLAASLVRRHINYKWDFSRTCRHPAWPGARGLLPEGGVGGGAAARHDGHHLVGPPVDASQHHPWPISSGELYSWKSVSQNSYLQTISTEKTEMIHVNSTLTPWLHTDSPRKVCESWWHLTGDLTTWHVNTSWWSFWWCYFLLWLCHWPYREDFESGLYDSPCLPLQVGKLGSKGVMWWQAAAGTQYRHRPACAGVHCTPGCTLY